jgi:succinate dehydrogenase flavin-adding protein (antitoxin of CptAB toxin-antitoxin module)
MTEKKADHLIMFYPFVLEIIANYKHSMERLVSYHRSMPIETDELFDRLTQSYVNQLEENQAEFYIKFLDYFDRYLIQENHDIDHIHLQRLQSDIYLQLSYVSRPYQSQLYYNKHRKILNDNEHIINMYKNLSKKS